MMISTRGRYALRVLIDLAEHAERGYVPMKEIAERQGISLKYLERILRLTEGDLAPVACLECDAKPCSRMGECRTYPMWREFYQLVTDYFDHKTLADIIKIS